jgi:hypothetical protein
LPPSLPLYAMTYFEHCAVGNFPAEFFSHAVGAQKQVFGNFEQATPGDFQ